VEASRLETLTTIFRTLFNRRDLVLHPDMTAEDVPGWDSMNHMNLILLIESEFNIRLSAEEMMSLVSVGDLFQVVEQKTTPPSRAA
jgi:acyl carrier protein